MFASPWTAALAATLILPVGMLLLRCFDRARPLVLPSRSWLGLAAAMVATLGLSAILSPFRPIAILWSAPMLAPIAAFFLIFDYLHCDPDAIEQKRASLGRMRGLLAFAIAVAGVGEWARMAARAASLANLFVARNPFPLGHSNYTAGLALLMIPLFYALRTQRSWRVLSYAGIAFALVMLFTSGSRSGMLGLLAIAIGEVAIADVKRSVKWKIAAIALFAIALFVAANPRTRAMFRTSSADQPPNISNVQRNAMLAGGLMMGQDRPLLGWGPGTTPLVFPRYRARLDGGAENVLQLHSLPMQLWAEMGAAGVLCAVLGIALLLRDWRGDSAAALALAGYAIFSVFDFQLDVPVFGFAVAGLLAAIARPPPTPARFGVSAGLGVAATAIAVSVLTLGHRDPTPELNSAALRDSLVQAQPERSIALLQSSLALNDDQEIAHFNLGWLLVTKDPPAAARHFLAAARLVPDKGGVYFGLALAELNAGHRDAAADALALELLNDPVFVLSPWWQVAEIHALQPATRARFETYAQALAATMPETTWSGRELRYTRTLAGWFAGTVSDQEMARVANTPERRAYLAQHPDRASIVALPAQSFRRERIGYPVLMRNLDLPLPTDVWVVQEKPVRTSAQGFLWPDKGWLPSPMLIALLDRRDWTKN